MKDPIVQSNVLLLFLFVGLSFCKNRNDLSTSEVKVFNGTLAPEWETDVYKLPGGTGLLIPDIDGGHKSRLIATARHVVKKGNIKSKDETTILEVLETLQAPAKEEESKPDLKIIVLKDCVESKNKISLRSFDSRFLISKLAHAYGFGSSNTDANEIPQISSNLFEGQLRIKRLEKITTNPGESYTGLITVADDIRMPAWCPGDSGGPVITKGGQEQFWIGTLTGYYFASYVSTLCVSPSSRTGTMILTDEFFKGLSTALGQDNGTAISLVFNSTYSAAESSCALLSSANDDDILAEKFIVTTLRNLPIYFEDQELLEKDASASTLENYRMWPDRKKNAITFVKNYFAKLRRENGGGSWSLPSLDYLPRVGKYFRSVYPAPGVIPESILVWLRKQADESLYKIYFAASEQIRATAYISENTSLSPCMRSIGNAVIPISDYLEWINEVRHKYSCR